MLPEMRAVVFIDLWPEAGRGGYWKKRFTAIPPIAARAGYAIGIHHYTRLDLDGLAAAAPAGIILSGSRSNLLDDPTQDPRDGIALSAFDPVTALLARLSEVPVLGICFGLQYLTVAAGGTLARLPAPRRDPAWPIEPLEPDPLFAGLPAPRCVENHVWKVDRVAPGYRVVARSPDGVEGARHATLPRVGVQFHPEYFRNPGATADGERVLLNWLGTL
jgi:GMP synthase-like glutamine amidotransferase